MEIYDRGWRLKALRKKRGLSQKAVADRLGVDRAEISAYERNIATPRIDVLENLALLFVPSRWASPLAFGIFVVAVLIRSNPTRNALERLGGGL